MAIEGYSSKGAFLPASAGDWTLKSLAGVDETISAAELLQFAESFDRNGNGHLNRREMRIMSETLAGLVPRQGSGPQSGSGDGLTRLWNRADTDRSGGLSRSEARNLARSLIAAGSVQPVAGGEFPGSYEELAGADGKLDQSEQDALLQIADRNHDGELDEEEAAALGDFLSGIGEPGSQDMPESFDEAAGADGRLGKDELAQLADLLDPNKNGLDTSEAKKLAKLLNQLLGQNQGSGELADQIAPAMDEADSDGDGSISEDELSDLVSALMDGPEEAAGDSALGDTPANFAELAGVDKALSKGELKGFGEGLGLDLSKPLGKTEMKKLGEALLKVLG